MRRLSLLVLMVLVGAGCATASSSEGSSAQSLEEITVAPREPEPQTDPTPLPTTVEPSRVEPTASQPACEVGFVTRVRSSADGRVHVVITATNQATHAVSGTLVQRCPGSSAHLRGLPSGYVLGGTCTMGACAVDRTEEPFTLDVDESRTVAQLTLSTHGDTCNSALAPGAYPLDGSVELHGVASCVLRGATLQVASAGVTTEVSPGHGTPQTHERCPAVACAYNPCPPGVSPPPGCAGQCGCPGSSGGLQEQ